MPMRSSQRANGKRGSAGHASAARERAHHATSATNAPLGLSSLEARTSAPALMRALQQAIGNARANTLVGAMKQSSASIQRYAVPADLECDQVADWLSSNSPYAPEWAETRSTFTFNGRPRVEFNPLPDGSIEAHVTGNARMSVSVSSPIDQPQWNPSRRPNRAAVVSAWQAMRATLDAHENQHRQIAERERTRIQGEFRTLDFTVGGADRAAAQAAAQAEMQSRQAQWQTDAQAAQDAIDPFRGAVLTCPAPTNP